MASDRLVPTAKLPGGGGGFKHFLLRTPVGLILLFLVVARLLSAFGVLPPIFTTVSTVGLWLYAIGFAFWGLLGLRSKLLWRIRRKLVISYLLIGLVPTLLILSFFGLTGWLTLGQVSSYMLSTAIRGYEVQTAHAADLVVSELQIKARNASRLSDKAIRSALDAHVATVRGRIPDAGAIYLEHRRNRIQRVVATEGLSVTPSVGTTLPAWASAGFSGGLRIGGHNFVAGISSEHRSQTVTVVFLSPIERVLDTYADELGFHIDQVLTSVERDNEAENVFVAQKPLESEESTIAASGGLTFPWWALFPVRDLEAPPSEEPDLVFVQFGFPLLSFYDSITSPSLQIGPSGTDLGRVIVTALILLAVLFLIIQVSAIFIGLVLARSITSSVHALSQGTEHVRHGDFGYKVHVRSRDQLGELADSFNLMTTSIQDLLNQSAEKKRLEEELRIARSIQMSLLPKDRISVPGLSIAALCLPATEVGGDYYDFIPLEDGRLALLIADVSGKGTSAALYMAELKGLVLSLSQIYDSPRKLLVEANKILAQNLDSRSFITMAYAVIDMESARMTYARAGHNPIFQLASNGAGLKTHVLAPDGLGLALDRGAQFEKILREDSVALNPGDLFLFFTDGVSEAMNHKSELFGEERIRTLLEENADLSMDALREKIIDEVFGFAGGAVQHDDMTMVLVKVL